MVYKFVSTEIQNYKGHLQGIEFEIYQCPVTNKYFMDGGQWGIPVDENYISTSVTKGHKGYFTEVIENDY